MQFSVVKFVLIVYSRYSNRLFRKYLCESCKLGGIFGRKNLASCLLEISAKREARDGREKYKYNKI